ncbi:MAG TPA: hypothetical protein VNO35_00110 [Steroidobacteraceae bacterium]|nr:hypothetical protein [Steroidobacteraceae bacterium]
MNNQEAFDIAVLHLLNQAHGCVSSSGRGQYRGTRGGKNAIGALIPDHLYSDSMEGKTVHQLIAAAGPAYDKLREHLNGVSPRLLSELQDLHDRVGKCLPSLFRDIVLDGCPRVAQLFSLNLRMIRSWVAYRKIPGPQMTPRKPLAPVPQAVVVLSSPFSGADKREHSVGSLEIAATG